jgi:hypothetical protein
MAVRSDKRKSRLAEALHMYRMTDPIARPAVPDAETPTRAPQKEVLVRVEVIVLNEIVINILCREPDLHALDTHSLKLKHHEGAEHILEERLVYGDRNLIAGRQTALDEV